MMISLGADHRGFKYKDKIKAFHKITIRYKSSVEAMGPMVRLRI